MLQLPLSSTAKKDKPYSTRLRKRRSAESESNFAKHVKGLDEVTPRKLAWQAIFKKEPLELGFLLQSVYNILPTPVNQRGGIKLKVMTVHCANEDAH